MKVERRLGILVSAVALGIPMGILFQNFSPADLNARNAIIRAKNSQIAVQATAAKRMAAPNVLNVETEK